MVFPNFPNQNMMSANPAPQQQSVEQNALNGGGADNKQQISNFMNALQGVGAGGNNSQMNLANPANPTPQQLINPNMAYQNNGSAGGMTVAPNFNTNVDGSQQGLQGIGGLQLGEQAPSNGPLFVPNVPYAPNGQTQSLLSNPATQPINFAPAPPTVYHNPGAYAGGAVSAQNGQTQSLLNNPATLLANGVFNTSIPYRPVDTGSAVTHQTANMSNSYNNTLSGIGGLHIGIAPQLQPQGLGGAASAAGAGGVPGGVPAGVPLVSDQNLKTNIAPGNKQLADFMAAVGAHKYQYKQPELDGAGTFVGPMAQELEQTEAGKQAVIETARGKMVDTGRLALVNTSALGVMYKEQQRMQATINDLRRKVKI